MRKKNYESNLLVYLIKGFSVLFIMILPLENFSTIELVHSKFLKMILILSISILLIIHNKKKVIKLNPLTILLICYLVLTSINLIISSNQIGTLAKWGQFFNITIFFILFSQNSSAKEFLKSKFHNLVFISTIFIFILVFLQLNFDMLWPHSVVNSVTGKDRPVAFFNNTNGMSGFLVLNNLYLLWFLFFQKKKPYLILSLVLGVLSLYWGGSAGAYLSFGFGVTFLVLFKVKKVKIALLFTITFALLGIALVALSADFWNLIINTLEKEARYNLWHTTILMINDYWLTGIGNYNFNNMLQAYGYFSPYGAQHPHPHNIFLDLVVTYGIIGFILSILVILVLLKYFIDTFKSDNKSLKLITVLLFSSLLRDIIDGGFLLGTSSVALYLYTIIAVYSNSENSFVEKRN